jgi:hypothetical protein
VKQNFLYNRTYYNIDTLNEDVLGWLSRTANGQPHAFTQKEPWSELSTERPFLKPYMPHTLKAIIVTYSVRKDNTISYKSNLYSLPLGTYQGRGTLVAMVVVQGELILSNMDNAELCRHKIASGQGIKIINTDHKRDKSSAITEMIDQICSLLDAPSKGKQWMDTIHLAKPRYTRDQLMIIKKVIESTDRTIINKALDYCIENKIASGSDFKSIVMQYNKPAQLEKEAIKIIQLNPLGGIRPDSAMVQPDKSKIEDYETIFKNNQNDKP